MLKRIEGPPEKRAKFKARCALKDCKKKTRPKDELEALREEIEELRRIIELLAET